MPKRTRLKNSNASHKAKRLKQMTFGKPDTPEAKGSHFAPKDFQQETLGKQVLEGETIAKGVSVMGADTETSVINVEKAGDTAKQSKAIMRWLLDEMKWTHNILPSKNVAEWEKEYVEELSERVSGAKAGKFSPAQLAKEVKSVAESMEGIIEDDESSPSATVIYSDDDTPQTIGHYHDYTDGEFRVEWKSTDAWRGYNEVYSDNWKKVHSDNILSMSADAEELKKFDDALQDMLKKQDIRFARVFTTSSNVFSQGYDFFVEKGRAGQAVLLAKLLAVKFRDPERYNLTAMTGADPSDATPADRKFADIASRMLAGKLTYAQAKKEIEKDA